MILAIAIVGLSASLIHEEICSSELNLCLLALRQLWNKGSGEKTVRYCMFLGLYGIVIAAVGTAALFVDRIPMVVPLVGDSLGALFYLAGGIAWVVNFGGAEYTCSDWDDGNASHLWYSKATANACKRC